MTLEDRRISCLFFIFLRYYTYGKKEIPHTKRTCLGLSDPKELATEDGNGFIVVP